MKTTHKEIADYWLTERAAEQVSLPPEEAMELCWRCRCHKPLQRCHIDPESLGGVDEPHNLVLLCELCHKEAPNHANPEYMPIWIKATRADFPGYFWTIRALEMFETIFGRPIGEGLSLDESENIITKIKKEFESQINSVVVHYGEINVNTSTMACVLAEIERKISLEHGTQQKIRR